MTELERFVSEQVQNKAVQHFTLAVFSAPQAELLPFEMFPIFCQLSNFWKPRYTLHCNFFDETTNKTKVGFTLFAFFKILCHLRDWSRETEACSLFE